jgi:flagellar FliJ protein
MKKFRFPLKSVETIRSMKELRAREQFSLAVHAYVLAEENLETARGRAGALAEALRTGRTGIFRAGDEVGFIEAYKAELDTVAKASAAVEKAKEGMEAARQAWLNSRRDLRVIENLERKARALHRHEVEREEQAALDDRTGAMAGRAAAV